jgi:hypothetical protein
MRFPFDSILVDKPLILKRQRIAIWIIGLYLDCDRAAQHKGGRKNHGPLNDRWPISALGDTGARRDS